MSTADSQLLLASAIATDDLPFIRAFAYQIGTHARVWLGRSLLLAVGVIAAFFALIHPESVTNLVDYAWGGMGAAFGPVTILALYWRRFNLWGALASIITGTVVASIWGYMSGGPGGVWDIQTAAPGYMVAIPVAVAVTLLTPRPSEKITELFDSVNPTKETVRPGEAF
jgi:sodium/proline symporter